MSLDPLNVGLLKTWGENLVIAFSWFFFLVNDQNATSFAVCKLALDASFQQIDMKHHCLYFTFLRENIFSFHGKTRTIYDLESPLVCFFYEEEAIEKDMFTRIKIISLLWPVTHSSRVAVYRSVIWLYIFWSDSYW